MGEKNSFFSKNKNFLNLVLGLLLIISLTSCASTGISLDKNIKIVPKNQSTGKKIYISSNYTSADYAYGKEEMLDGVDGYLEQDLKNKGYVITDNETNADYKIHLGAKYNEVCSDNSLLGGEAFAGVGAVAGYKATKSVTGEVAGAVAGGIIGTIIGSKQHQTELYADIDVNVADLINNKQYKNKVSAYYRMHSPSSSDLDNALEWFEINIAKKIATMF